MVGFEINLESLAVGICTSVDFLVGGLLAEMFALGVEHFGLPRNESKCHCSRE